MAIPFDRDFVQSINPVWGHLRQQILIQTSSPYPANEVIKRLAMNVRMRGMIMCDQTLSELCTKYVAFLIAIAW